VAGREGDGLDRPVVVGAGDPVAQVPVLDVLPWRPFTWSKIDLISSSLLASGPKSGTPSRVMTTMP
jgi:hypothetical protein